MRDESLDEIIAEMEPRGESDFVDLIRAIRDSFEGDSYYSKNLTMRFGRWSGGDRTSDEISMFIEGIDNVYHEEKGWKWEIFLKGDGTWRIA